jgi:hypothetical protein
MSNTPEILKDVDTLTIKKAQERAEIESILVTSRANALMVLMEAEERYFEKLAAATETLNAAENTLSDEIIQMRLKMAMMAVLPEILKTTKQSLEELIPHLRELIRT